MKKFLSILTLVFMVALISCQEYHQQQQQTYDEERNRPPTYRVVEVEGCEYLRFDVTHGYAVLTHKGNCHNPVHCYQDTTTQRIPMEKRE